MARRSFRSRFQGARARFSGYVQRRRARRRSRGSRSPLALITKPQNLMLIGLAVAGWFIYKDQAKKK